MRKFFLLLCLSSISAASFSAANYQSGKIKNLTATTSGIMIMMDAGLPDNCAGTPYGWMLIKQEHTAMTSVVLAAWASGNKSGTVYTSGREGGVGYCLISQFDPVN
ncbi:hypothetical protein [Vibrio nigripulchritudo]|uniref:hypothetical protein n=1 Tax=Vibrio nigripulchritudo TaxID=28173 RepID=UPI0005F9CD7A|nr:hypothetical protein [Vibrio nigripulchritudo]KJY73828.1 hypothetical protein TW74_21205 [Vibrio nigripulchritudo]